MGPMFSKPSRPCARISGYAWRGPGCSPPVGHSVGGASGLPPPVGLSGPVIAGALQPNNAAVPRSQIARFIDGPPSRRALNDFATHLVNYLYSLMNVGLCR